MELTTHYTGIGSEIREDAINNATKVVVNLPQGLGRYDIEDASNQYVGIDPEHLAGYIPSAKFEWYLKNHLGSTMLVYGTQSYDDLMKPNFVGLKSAYDYRAFGEQVDLTILFNDKVTETFTGKEKDDETELSNHGARMLDPMLGVWIAVDPYREFYHSYAYGPANPINGFDSDGRIWVNVGNPFFSNQIPNFFTNYLPWLEKGQTIMGKTSIGLKSSNGSDVRVRHIVQRWEYDPNASDEINSRHSIGTLRIINQVLLKRDEAMRLFQMEYAVEYADMRSIWYDSSQEEWWHPTIFNDTYHENGNAIMIPPQEQESQIKITIGEMTCDNCTE